MTNVQVVHIYKFHYCPSL